jgi:hypothetical protein
MSSDALRGAFDALEIELSRAGARLKARRARRRRRVLGAVVIASLLAITATASGLIHIPISEQDDPTANHAASALGLSADEAAVLLKAQQLGQVVVSCYLAHGATEGVGGGLDDPTGEAKRACKTESEANENFLNSPEFRAVEAAALPRIMDAARCFQSYTGVKPGTMIGDDGKRPSEAVLAAGRAACFRPNGLPK